MADIIKAVAAGIVTFTANTPRAEPWMMQRFRGHTITFDTTIPRELEGAIAFEAAARTLDPPLTFDDL